MSAEISGKKQITNSDGAKGKIPFEIRFQNSVDIIYFYLNNLWKLKTKFIIFNLSILVLAVSYLIFLTEPYYNSSITILPDYGSKETSLGQLGSLAALAGVNVGSGTTTEIYQNLILSESVLAPVIYSKYKTEKFSDSVDLIKCMKIKPDQSLPADLRDRYMFIKAYNILTKSKLSSEVDRLTKILTVSAEMPEGQLSADVVNKIAISLDNYVRTKRKSFASEQRKYIEMRLMQVKDSLSYAENRLMNFKERNRLVMQSPVLLLRQVRLSRNVEIMNAVYLELSKQLELAKISEVKDTPVLNIREFARDPIKKTGPKRLNVLIIILSLSILFSGTYFAFSTVFKKYFAMIGLKRIRLNHK